MDPIELARLRELRDQQRYSGCIYRKGEYSKIAEDYEKSMDLCDIPHYVPRECIGCIGETPWCIILSTQFHWWVTYNLPFDGHTGDGDDTVHIRAFDRTTGKVCLRDSYEDCEYSELLTSNGIIVFIDRLNTYKKQHNLVLEYAFDEATRNFTTKSIESETIDIDDDTHSYIRLFSVENLIMLKYGEVFDMCDTGPEALLDYDRYEFLYMDNLTNVIYYYDCKDSTKFAKINITAGTVDTN